MSAMRSPRVMLCGEIADDFLVAVGFTQVFDFENVFSAGTLLIELDIRPCDVRLGSSVTCRRSTSLRRDWTWLERVPAAKRQ